MELDDRELLARIIQCEAGGEGDAGMRAVASVIMNRVNVPYCEYHRVGQGNLRSIIYQKGQFDCVREIIGGKPNMQTVYNMSPEAIHFEIADWALAGNILGEVGDSLWYFNPYAPCVPYFPYNKSGAYHTNINNHCFYRPTELYAKT